MAVPLPADRGRLVSVPTGREVLRGTDAAEARAYDPERFYVSAYDDKGHCAKVRINVDQGVINALSHALANGELRGTNLKSVNDVFRAGLVDVLHKISHATQSGAIAQQAARQRAIAEVDMMRQEIRESQELISRVEDALSDAFSTKDQFVAARVVAQAEQIVEEMREPYYGEMMRVIDNANRQLTK